MPATSRRTGAACLALLAVLAAACGELGPRDVAGTYTLRSVAGQPLPWLAWYTAGSGAHYVDADTLWLDPTGVARHRSYPLNFLYTDVSGDSGSWAVSGSKVLIHWHAAYPGQVDTVTAAFSSPASGPAELRIVPPFMSAEFRYVR